MSFSFKDVESTGGDNSNKTPTSTRNVAVRVASYDVAAGTTTGVDIQTGEEVTIALRSLGKSFDKQSNVEEWSKPKGKKSVATGEKAGVIVFESVIRDPESGALSSRWGVVASHNADEADVAVVHARPATSFRDRTQVDEKRAIEIARTEQAQLVKTEAELREAMAAIIARPFTQVVVRAMDEDGQLRVATVWKGKDNTAEQAVTNFRNTNNYIGRFLNDENMAALAAVEVFPLERIYAGADTREMLRDDSKLPAQRFVRDWSLGEGKGFGFGESLVSLRTHDEGGQMFTSILPAVNRQPLWSLESLPTVNIKPSVAPTLSSDVASEAGPAAKAREDAEGPDAGEPAAPAAAAPLSEDQRSEIANKMASGGRLFRQR
jgi:hypothetical protein